MKRKKIGTTRKYRLLGMLLGIQSFQKESVLPHRETACFMFGSHDLTGYCSLSHLSLSLSMCEKKEQLSFLAPAV